MFSRLSRIVRPREATPEKKTSLRIKYLRAIDIMSLSLRRFNKTSPQPEAIQ